MDDEVPQRPMNEQWLACYHVLATLLLVDATGYDILSLRDQATCGRATPPSQTHTASTDDVYNHQTSDEIASGVVNLFLFPDSF